MAVPKHVPGDSERRCFDVFFSHDHDADLKLVVYIATGFV